MLISAMLATRGAVRGFQREVLTVLPPVVQSGTVGAVLEDEKQQIFQVAVDNYSKCLIRLGVVFMAAVISSKGFPSVGHVNHNNLYSTELNMRGCV